MKKTKRFLNRIRESTIDDINLLKTRVGNLESKVRFIDECLEEIN